MNYLTGRAVTASVALFFACALFSPVVISQYANPPQSCCDIAPCEAGTVCKLEEFQCLAEPCVSPVPVCVDPSECPICTRMSCPLDKVCVLEELTCVDSKSCRSCPTLKCLDPCELTCKNIKCDPGYVCEMVRNKKRYITPCPTEPRCVPCKS